MKKICSKCGVEKDVEEFFEDRRIKNGLQTYCKLCHKKYRENNKEKISKNKSKYYLKNKERIKQYQKQYLKTENGKLIKKLAEQRRRAKKMSLPNTLTKQEWKDTLDYFDNSCANCGSKDDLHMDHFIALSDEENCSGTTKFNCIPLCEDCNLAKNKRDPEVFFSKESFERITKYLLAFV